MFSGQRIERTKVSVGVGFARRRVFGADDELDTIAQRKLVERELDLGVAAVAAPLARFAAEGLADQVGDVPGDVGDVGLEERVLVEIVALGQVLRIGADLVARRVATARHVAGLLQHRHVEVRLAVAGDGSWGEC